MPIYIKEDTNVITGSKGTWYIYKCTICEIYPWSHMSMEFFFSKLCTRILCYACFWVRLIIWGKIGRKHCHFGLYTQSSPYIAHSQRKIFEYLYTSDKADPKNKTSILFVAIRLVLLQTYLNILLISTAKFNSKKTCYESLWLFRYYP